MIFKNWAFRLFIYTIIFNICIAIIAFNRTIVVDEKMKSIIEPLTIWAIIADLMLITGIVFTIASIIKKESKDYKFYISSFGFGIFLIAEIVMRFEMYYASR
jgi:hypothetical protein